MSNPYTEPSISGYDASPPTDDGANTSANEITWSKHKTKHGDPLKNYSDAINSAITSAFALNFLNAISTHSSGYTVLTGDRGKLLDASNTITIDLLAAATAGDGFAIAIRNAGSGVITIDGNSSETINGVTTLILGIGEHVVLSCDGSNWSGLVGNNFGGMFVKGADVASANTLTLGADGNYFDITGTTAITSIVTRGVRGLVKLHFDAILTLTHDATDLILPGGANITTAAGDEAEFIEYASGDWRCTNYQQVKNIFVNNSNGNPNVSDTTNTISSTIAEGAWESLGPTGSGADNIWTALDSVPTSVGWVEIKVFSQGISVGDTNNFDRSLAVHARKNGGSQAVGNDNEIGGTRALTGGTGGAYTRGITVSRIPVSSVVFDAVWSSTFNSSTSIELYLVGYGWN